MRNILFIVLLALTVHEESGYSKLDSIVGRLELSTISNKKFGKLIAVTIRIKNTSNQKLYLDGILPLFISVLKETEGGRYQDYTSGWVSDEVNNNNHLEIGHATGQSIYQERACKFGSVTLIDTFVSSFYYNQLMNKDLIKTREDSTNLKLWVCHQFNGLLYLKANETVESVYGINSLPAGSYKIFFTYSNKNGYARRISPYEKFDKFQLPDKLNGFQRWRGEIAADTLILNVR